MFEIVFGSEKFDGCEIEISMLCVCVCVKCSFGFEAVIFACLPKAPLLPWESPAVECQALMKL